MRHEGSTASKLFKTPGSASGNDLECSLVAARLDSKLDVVANDHRARRTAGRNRSIECGERYGVAGEGAETDRERPHVELVPDEVAFELIVTDEPDETLPSDGVAGVWSWRPAWIQTEQLGWRGCARGEVVGDVAAVSARRPD